MMSDSAYARMMSTMMLVSISLSAPTAILAQYLNCMCTSTSTTKNTDVHNMVYV